VQEALDAQKEEFARREVWPVLISWHLPRAHAHLVGGRACVVQEAFRRREEGLRKKDLDLQESLIRFNKFLQVPPCSASCRDVLFHS